MEIKIKPNFSAVDAVLFEAEMALNSERTQNKQKEYLA
jgi:hypothetical protein